MHWRSIILWHWLHSGGFQFVPTTAYFALINRWQSSGTGKKLLLEMSAVRRDNDNDKTFDGKKLILDETKCKLFREEAVIG